MRSRSEAQAQCRGVHQALATSCAADGVEVGGARHGKAGIVGCVNVGGSVFVDFVRFAVLGTALLLKAGRLWMSAGREKRWQGNGLMRSKDRPRTSRSMGAARIVIVMLRIER
jgi:hypothetical protein